MYLSDDTLDKMLQRFQLDEDERGAFIESFRSLQIEIMIKSFVVYYESHKSPLELKYLETISKGFETDPQKYLQKFITLFTAEAENNPQMLVFVEQRMVPLITDTIKAFASVTQDREAVKEIVESLFENIDLVGLLEREKEQVDSGTPQTNSNNPPQQ